MNQVEIIEMAKETIGDYSTNDYWPFFTEELQKFAALVAAKEREACAQLVQDKQELDPYAGINGWVAANAIRALKEGKP